jgi:hypothetical protein
MFMNRHAWAVIAAAMLAAPMLADTPAGAAIVTVTAEGTVNNYADGSLELFGVPASTLFGAPMEEVFTFDLSKGTIQLTFGGWYRTGSGSDTLGPVVVTIGGHVREIDGSRLSNFVLGTADTLGFLDVYSSEDTGTLLTAADTSIENTIPQLLSIGGKTHSVTVNLAPADDAFMNLLAETDCGLASCRYDEWGGALNSITLAVSAPEPSTWAMMIAGFGAIGTIMRRRQRATRRWTPA